MPILALDVGGTKIAAALVEAGRILERREIATPREAGADGWLAAVADLAAPWRGAYRAVGAAVTGLVEDGLWWALNPDTLPVPAGFPLAAQLSLRLGAAAHAWNDAQAAAWGEYRHGAGRSAGGGTMAFVTISTGIGGGVVAGGRLLEGLAGHFGQWRGGGAVAGAPAEAGISGSWIAAEAARNGCPADARLAFEAAGRGDPRAREIVSRSAGRAAALFLDIHLALDPDPIVVGGGIGLAEGYLAAVEAEFAALPPRLRPRLVPAALGADAGLVGAADLTLALPLHPAERT